MVQGDEVIGHVYIDAPARAEGYQVSTPAGSAIVNAPVTGFEAGRLTVCFRAGIVPGNYVVTFKLNGGNSVTMFIDVIDSVVVQPADPAACQPAVE